MKITKQQYEDYLDKVKKRPNFIRLGQALVNELFFLNPEIYRLVIDRVDPFSVDGRIPAFLDELSKYVTDATNS
jgi:hypothetical protein